MMTNSPSAAQTVCARSTLFGEFVEIEFPFAFLEPKEAEQLAQRLIVAAYLVRQRSTEPVTRSLSLSEPFWLESAGASAAERSPAISSPGSDILGVGK